MNCLLVFKVTDFSVCLGGIIYFYKQPESTINNICSTLKSSTPSEVVSLLPFGVPVFFLTSPQMELKCSLYVEFVVLYFLQPWRETLLFKVCSLERLLKG